ncbi:hypothetical protein TGAMA5MH_05085 [Trichoderma gamsii]|uniref:Uncharacterized protein n=1 Tax=Trichoderma gamsii TaxID=398673 RepID=A0A2K0TCA4_9HYPO|nr:hypothetical protein TGAMA5MH_05085 [Trichoderma gamsii]
MLTSKVILDDSFADDDVSKENLFIVLRKHQHDVEAAHSPSGICVLIANSSTILIAVFIPEFVNQKGDGIIFNG